MAVLYITEYANMTGLNGLAQIAMDPPTANQTVAIGGASAQSSAFNNKTRFIRVHTDAICSVEVALSPTATVTTRRLAANQTEYFGVNAAWKIAVISNT